MSNHKLKGKIRRVLRQGFDRPDDKITLSDGVNGNVHVRIESRRFVGRGLLAKHELVWAELERGLSQEECGRVTLIQALRPGEKLLIERLSGT